MLVKFRVIQIPNGQIGIFINGNFFTETDDKNQVKGIIKMATHTIGVFTGEDAIMAVVESNIEIDDFQDVEIVVS